MNYTHLIVKWCKFINNMNMQLTLLLIYGTKPNGKEGTNDIWIENQKY